MVLLQRKLYFPKDPEGVQHFLCVCVCVCGGVGVQMLISIETHITCDFFQGGVWTPTPPPSPWIFSPQLILQFTEGVQWFYCRENYTFPRIQRGSNIFSVCVCGGGGGVQMLISIETHITCDFFQGGVWTPTPPPPPPPLWICT